MYLQVVPSGTPVDNQHLIDKVANPQDESYMRFTSDMGSAMQYTLDPYGNMISIAPSYDYSFWADDADLSISQHELVFVVDVFDATFNNQALVTCSIAPVTLLLSCMDYGATVPFDSAGILSLGTSQYVATDDETIVMLRAVYLSYGAPSNGLGTL